MLCERCKKNEANYYYHENVNGTEKTYHLCGACAEELEKSGEIKQFNLGFPKMGLFDTLFGSDAEEWNTVFGSLFAPAQGQGMLKSPTVTKCSLCGASFEDLAREGKAGCPKCYEVFADELDESIRRIHGRTSHTGRAPARFREKNEAKRKMRQMEKELKEAVHSEDYEKAASLRDQIRALRAAGEENGAEGTAPSEA